MRSKKNIIIAVIGGKLQGVEVLYLARKAGFKTLLIDKNPQAPAVELCDRFIQFEFGAALPFPPDHPEIDLLFPAIEDETVLSLLCSWAESSGIPLAYDPAAYAVSKSKFKSDALFQKMNLPAPIPWPDSKFPVVVKPDQSSGSQGVEIFHTPDALRARFPDPKQLQTLIIQTFLEGPSYSIEVLGTPGHYTAMQVTDLFMDKVYDCNKVTAPTELSGTQVHRFEKMAIAVAEAIELKGIMDVEVILHQGELKLLEIDARFPSQTPITVYWSTEINMVEILADLFVHKTPVSSTVDAHCGCPVLVEHIEVLNGQIEFSGEHIMAQDGPLTLHTDFFHANEAVTSYQPHRRHWVATMIFRGDSPEEIMRKRTACHREIRKNC